MARGPEQACNDAWGYHPPDRHREGFDEARRGMAYRAGTDAGFAHFRGTLYAGGERRSGRR